MSTTCLFSKFLEKILHVYFIRLDKELKIHIFLFHDIVRFPCNVKSVIVSSNFTVPDISVLVEVNIYLGLKLCGKAVWRVFISHHTQSTIGDRRFTIVFVSWICNSLGSPLCIEIAVLPIKENTELSLDCFLL